jgi:hypothetical protein
VPSFTPNIGLTKVLDSEMAQDWAADIGPKYQEDNNLAIIDHMDVNLIAYTPFIAGQSGNPFVGATGSVAGEYQDIEGIIMGQFIVTFGGAGLSSGSGEYGISLPAIVDPVFHSVGGSLNATPGTFSVVGEGYHYDASTATTSGTCALDVVTFSSVSYVRFLTEPYAAPVKTNRMFASSMPYAMADSDRFIGNFIYKRT